MDYEPVTITPLETPVNWRRLVLVPLVGGLVLGLIGASAGRFTVSELLASAGLVLGGLVGIAAGVGIGGAWWRRELRRRAQDDDDGQHDG